MEVLVQEDAVVKVIVLPDEPTDGYEKIRLRGVSIEREVPTMANWLDRRAASLGSINYETVSQICGNPNPVAVRSNCVRGIRGVVATICIAELTSIRLAVAIHCGRTYLVCLPSVRLDGVKNRADGYSDVLLVIRSEQVHKPSA